ncbi:MAG: RluA family pseudouridine synthase [Bdellovibrionales bacterium]|nr:RluA family pseudouridine synthase [Bdellovibrionales bacterium]
MHDGTTHMLEEDSLNIDLPRIYDALVSIYHQFKYLEVSLCPASVLEALCQELPHIDTRSWEARHLCGGIYLNGRPCALTDPLPVPCKVEYYEPKGGPEEIYKRIFDYPVNSYVLYEDDYLLAVWKPASIHCLPAKEQQLFFLQKLLEDYCGTKIHMPSRLDYSTSGVVLVSKHVDSHAPLQQAYENRTIQKYYVLATDTCPDWHERHVACRIARDPRHHILRRPHPTEGKPSETDFKVLRSDPCLLLAKPKTGRTHQIRVHAAYSGFPIIGDNFYNGRPSDSLHLASIALRLSHPISKVALRIDANEDFLPSWCKNLTELYPSLSA